MVDVARYLRLGDHESLCELLLNSPDPSIRQRSAQGLGELMNAQATPSLIQALSDSIWEVSNASAKALECIGEQALPELEKALQSPIQDVRRLAVQVICSIGGPATFELLKALLLEAEEDLVRMTAGQALACTREPFTLPVLVKALNDSAWEVRRIAARGLGNLGDKAALEALSGHLSNEKNGKVQTALQEALAQLEVL